MRRGPPATKFLNEFKHREKKLDEVCTMIKEKLIKDRRASKADFDGSNVDILRIGSEKSGISATKDEDPIKFGQRILEALWLKSAQTTN